MTLNLNDKSLKQSGPNVSQLSTYSKVWIGLMDAFAKLRHDSIDVVNEMQHKSTFEHQVCHLKL